MATICSTDTIFATVSYCGSMIANMRISGAESMAHVMNAVRSRVGHVAGLVTVDLRNTSQGWNSRRSVMII